MFDIQTVPEKVQKTRGLAVGRSDATERALIGDPFGTQTRSSSSCLLLIKPTVAAVPRYRFTFSMHRKALKDYCTTANLT